MAKAPKKQTTPNLLDQPPAAATGKPAPAKEPKTDPTPPQDPGDTNTEQPADDETKDTGTETPTTDAPQPDSEGTQPETFDAVSDQRTDNNVMRHEYRTLDDREKEQMAAIKDAGEGLLGAIDWVAGPERSRELELAAQKAEEAVFWAVKHVTR